LAKQKKESRAGEKKAFWVSNEPLRKRGKHAQPSICLQKKRIAKQNICNTIERIALQNIYNTIEGIALQNIYNTTHCLTK
jgi:hypothetical protein